MIANTGLHPDDADEFYKRLLTACWRESFRILKPGGLLVFTFHHSEDEPWVAVLESLFDAGFILEATYPVRSDESKGDGQFGSKKIEYDIVHVCRKRTEQPKKISWARLRREVVQEVQQLASVLEHHEKEGLLPADLQVIMRGKALEYYSRHYDQVYIDESRQFWVRDALIGINQLLEEESGAVKNPPPGAAEPLTRQFLRLFDSVTELPRDQMQKFLRGTGISPDDFTSRGWCEERAKIYYLVSPLELAQGWRGQDRKRMSYDYDQAMFFIGACFADSGISLSDTLKNERFQPHPALADLLEWFVLKGGSPEIKGAAARAKQIYKTWERQHPEDVKQLTLFMNLEE